MTSPIDISPDHMRIVCDILQKHLPPLVNVWAFGSRADWTTKNSSDLDLALEGKCKLDYEIMDALEYAFEESDLPYKVDVIDLNRISDNFRRIVDAHKVPVDEHNMKTHFADVVSINPKRELKKDSAAKFVNMGAIKPFTRKIPNHTIKKYKGGSKFKNGDTLFARITPSLENGKIAFVDFLDEDEVGFGSAEFIVLAAKKHVLPLFVYYLSRSDLVRNAAIKSMTGTSGRQRVESDVLKNIKVFLPPIKQQKQIVKILSEIDSKIELNQRMSQVLEQMVQAIFKSWFVDFEFPDENGRPYRSSGGEMVHNKELDKKIPNYYRIGKLTDLAVNIKKIVKPEDITAEQTYIGLEHMPRNSIVLSEWETAKKIPSSKYQFKQKQILFGKPRPYLKKIGFAPLDGVCSTDILVINSKKPEFYGYLLGILSSDDFINFVNFINYTNMASTGTRMPRTDWKTMCKYSIVIPESTIIIRYNKLVDAIIEKIIHINIESRNLVHARDSLLPKLMSGKIGV